MAITLAVGTQIFIASTYGAAKTMSAISNAAEAVATLEASHGVIENDILEVASGWQRLTNRIVRADSVATNDVTLEDINTSDTDRYPAGTGTGSVREITAWTQVTQLRREINFTGGEQQFADVTTLEDVIEQQIPTRRSPIQLSLPTFFDGTQSYVAVVRTAADTATLTAVKMVFPDGSVLYGNAYWTYQEIPTIQDETLSGRVDLSFRGLTTFYTA